jgi:hypothetical protein
MPVRSFRQNSFCLPRGLFHRQFSPHGTAELNRITNLCRDGGAARKLLQYDAGNGGQAKQRGRAFKRRERNHDITNLANRGSLPENFPYSRDRVVRLDLGKKTIGFAPGIVIPSRPFWGDIGVAPPPSKPLVTVSVYLPSNVGSGR